MNLNCCMASACATATSRPLIWAPSACPSSKKSATATNCRRRRTVTSCRATGGDNGNDLWLPRRDMMLTAGLSGVAAAGLAWYPGLASGADSTSPCTAADPVNDTTLQCTDTSEHPCPLVSPTGPVDFTPEGKVKRVRHAAHLLSPDYQAKYRLAVQKMKELPDDNPLSFKSQAAIHEAFCDSYYSYHRQKSTTSSSTDDPRFDVHFSWIFAPWHRMYIYFYEKALGDLIGDDTFALPYWNWDHPDGMAIPPVFKPEFITDDKLIKNYLYDGNRNTAHVDALLDLDYLANRSKPGYTEIPFAGPKDDDKYKEAVYNNLCTVYTQQVKNGQSAKSFLGDQYCTDLGTSKSSAGTLEQMAHTSVHVWVGKTSASTTGGATCTADSGGFPTHDGGYNCNNDMGFLGSAGFDPLFYSHHSNVDRMWHVWATTLGGQNLPDDEWLDTSFVFWDDVKSPKKVRITFRDVLDTKNLGYTYDRETARDLPWMRCKITSLVPHDGNGKKKPSTTTARKLMTAPAVVFPVALTVNEPVVVAVVAVPEKEKGNKEEQVLVIEGIEYDPEASNKFDVAINVPKDKAVQVGPQYREYAGSFAVVPGTGGGSTGTTRKGKVSLCITQVLKDIQAEGDATVDVVIVPRTDAKVTLTASPTIQNRQ